jgi:hypothetical protein
VSRSTIAGQLPLLRDGRIPAELNEFDLEGDALEFTLEVPLSAQLLSGLTRSTSPLIRLPPSAPRDAVLRVSWGIDLADEVGLLVPARSQAFAHARVRYGQPPEQPELEPVRSSIKGTRWRHRLRFQPLPEQGELTFRLSSQLLDIRNAVGVVPIANLRSRVI